MANAASTLPFIIATANSVGGISTGVMSTSVSPYFSSIFAITYSMLVPRTDIATVSPLISATELTGGQRGDHVARRVESRQIEVDPLLREEALVERNEGIEAGTGAPVAHLAQAA